MAFGEFTHSLFPDDNREQPNPLTRSGLGGAAGAQVGSQTGGSGAGLPSAPMFLPLPGDWGGAEGGVAPAPAPWSPTVPGMQPPAGQPGPQPFPTPSPAPTQTSDASQAFQTVRNLQTMLTQAQSTQDPRQQAVLNDQVMRSVTQSLTEQGHNVQVRDGQLVVDGMPYTLGSSMASGPSVQVTPQNGGNVGRGQFDADEWMPSSVSYAPGDIPMGDVPTFSYEQLLGDMTGPNGAATGDLIRRILENPESLDARTLDTMKARSKDELADLHTRDLDRLGELGVAYGIEDSPWLASEELSARGRRNEALVSGNRELELEAARTNFSDRLNAAQAGMAHGSQQAGNVSAAASGALQSAAATGDRLALRESVAAEAARLGQSEQQLMASYITSRLDDITRRYGIDIGAQISREQLEQADSHFQEELALALERMAQEEAQWASEYDLSLREQSMLEEQLEHNRTMDLWGLER